MTKTRIYSGFVSFDTYSQKKQRFVKLLQIKNLYREQSKKKMVSVHPLTILNCKPQKKESSLSSRNILEIINETEKAMNKNQVVLSSDNIVCAISGGQDSIFLLFCFLFLQSQIAFKCKIIWCNHFWQIASFYTTLHLTKCAVSFSSPIIAFLALQVDASPFFYRTVLTKYKIKKVIELEKKTLNLKTESKQYKPLFLKKGNNAFLSKDNLLQEKILYFYQKDFKGLQNKTFLLNSFSSIKNGVPDQKYCNCTHIVPRTSFRLCFAFATRLRNTKKKLFSNFCFAKKNFARTNFLTYKFSYKAKLCTCLLSNKSSYKSSICTCISFALVKNLELKKVEKAKLYQTKIRCTHKICKKVQNNCLHRFVFTSGLVWPLLFYNIELNVKGYKKFVNQISETRARNWRHITIERGCTFYGSKTCVYGHTGSDRIETILFNLIRGSGNRGIASLPWKRRHSHFCYNKFYPSYKQVLRKTHLNESLLYLKDK